MTKPMVAGDKLAFLLSFVPYLLERGRVSVTEAAEHFGVSAQRVRDTVRLIGVSGIPGETRQYQPDDLFDISWDALEEHDEIEITQRVVLNDSPRFSAREAAALMAGLQYIRAMPSNTDDETIAVLMQKLAAGAVSAVPHALVVNPTAPHVPLTDVRRALVEGMRLTFAYRNERSERTERSVDPWRIDSVDDAWYLRGWDHDREDSRTFRLDRMSSVTVTTTPISREPRPGELGDQLFTVSPEHPNVELEVATDALDLISEYFDDDTSPRVEGELARVVIPVAQWGVLGRLVGAHPDLVTVLAPPEARRAVTEWARRALENYDESTQAPSASSAGESEAG